MRKIKRVAIRNYRGVEELDLAVPEGGATAKGRNGAGKTTILKAVKAALLAQDVGADAIRKGSSKSEILVDIDDLSVRRVITEKGNRLDVEKGEFAVNKPQTYLKDLLGTSSLDPMDLLTLKGKARRSAVLAALPVTITVEQLRKYWPKCPDNYDCSGHGLEVVAVVREMAYRRRTEKNKAAKEAEAELDRARSRAEAAASRAPTEGPDLERLQDDADTARANYVSLQSRAAEAEAQREVMDSKRTRVLECRAQAERIREKAEPVTAEALEQADLDADNARAEVEILRARLKEAEKAFRAASELAINLHADKERYKQAIERYNQAIERAVSFDQQADELDEAIETAAIKPVPASEMEAAKLKADSAREQLRAGRVAYQHMLEAQSATRASAEAETAATEAKAEAARVDEIVKALTNDAPAELLAAADGIEGLSLEGDEVMLDGVRLDALCGAEQIRFCVEVARRANAKSKILICDGLERLDPEALDVFVAEATRDGYQLLATRVDRGDVVIEAIVADAAESEAA